jgi:AcrR family transcriptional regulator
MAASHTRARLLDAAITVAERNGAAHLTLDAVAADAGVSKGGLLYHFPDKESLLDGLLEAMLDRFDAALEAYDDGGPGAGARAYLRACVDPASALPGLSTALLSALANDPELLARAREQFATWRDRVLADATDPVLATVVRLAADGLWVTDAFALAPVEDADRAAVVEALERLAGTP